MGIHKRVTHGILFVALAVLAVSAQAAPPALDTGRSDASIKAPAETSGMSLRGFSFSGKAYLGGSSTIATSEADLAAVNQWVQVSASARHAKSGIGVGATGLLNRAVSGEQVTSDFDNPVFTLNRLWEDGEGWYSSFAFGLSGALPGNGSTRDDLGFVYAVGPYMEWVKEAGRFTITEMLSYSRGIYRAPVGSSLAVMPDVVKSATTLDFYVTEKFFLEAVLQVLGARSYESQNSYRAMWTAALVYEFNKTFSVDAGVGTCLGAGQPNGHYDQLGAQEGEIPRQIFADLGVSI